MLPDITALMARRLRCAGCMRRFRPQDIEALDSTEQRATFRLRCPMCHTERLVIAVWNKSAVRTFATDIDLEEWTYYRNASPINVDDVLRVHQMLAVYAEDFSDVLEDPLFDQDAE
jgi:hypothetical protein